MNEKLKSKLDVIFKSRLTDSEGVEIASYANEGATALEIRNVVINLSIALPKDFIFMIALCQNNSTLQ
ncbi:hypothetical protein CLV51_104284 [Chitinophaga niastensis]|uniref:Uncharacterized protein n=1 Tax=Chitinophaga niastensis TaxID=536980 RepID=A0A2P8HH76_CHINA|nr:hypothetical protein [Chitinophaga niastensis]PSL45578.1 hypothetical protein CLV51_104284 [Chitinophaga niastensis]